MEKYTEDQKKILEKDTSGGLFSPDIANPEVISKITDGARNLGEISPNGLDPQKLSSQTEAKEYLGEWGINMHKGEQDIAYEETESNTIIEQLARSTSDQAVAIPFELGKMNREIAITMPKWKTSDQAPDYVIKDSGGSSVYNVTIPGNLHNIGYENETLNFLVPESFFDRDNNTIGRIHLNGDNQYLKGTVNFGEEKIHWGTIHFEGENSIPGGVTNCYKEAISGGVLDFDSDEYTGHAIVPENATLNISGETSIRGNFVVKGVLNIGMPKTTEIGIVVSDGSDGWETGTLHDDVFSYTQDGNGVYSRTHTYPIDSTGKDLSSFPLTVTNAELDYVTEVNGTVKYENHKYLFTGSYKSTYAGNRTQNLTDYDLLVEGNSERGFYTSRDNMWIGSESRLVAAIFGGYQGH